MGSSSFLVALFALAGCAVGGNIAVDSSKLDARKPVDSIAVDSRAVDAASPGSSTLLWFKFDEPAGTGTVANSGTLANANPAVMFTQQGVPGRNGGVAIKFAATTDGVVVPNQAGLGGLTHVTVEAWIKYAAWNT